MLNRHTEDTDSLPFFQISRVYPGRLQAFTFLCNVFLFLAEELPLSVGNQPKIVSGRGQTDIRIILGDSDDIQRGT